VDHERFGKISVFFPMWNEEEYINRAVDAAREACQELIDDGEVSDYEILIVDDASTDSTGRIADELADADPHVRVVHHPKNRKLGGSVKTGFTEAKGDLVLYTDADLPFDMAELKRACRLLRIYEADLICAYRFDRTGEGFQRVIYSAIYNLLVRGFFGVRVRDVNFAFKLVRRSVLDGMTLTSEGSFIDAELVVRTVKSGKQMVQFGVDYFPRTRGISTLSSPAVIMKILQEMKHLSRELRSIEAA
jgi:glycosyltransferase involved in cell wall biosynthesis